MSKEVVTRIAPSPTGEMHIGTVRTALYNYLFAKHNGGTYLVRIEDTDKERNRPEWVEAIWRDFEWCGLMPDKRYVQSEHLPRHKELLQKLVAEDKAYVSQEPKKDDPAQTIEVVRLRNPGTSITFYDLVRGEITFDTAELKDFVIARSVNDPLFHFAVVVDDHDEGVTHVLRAEEHLSNTPRQILILEALGFERPEYAHIPLILAPDKTKLSKRHGAVSVNEYRAQGFIPEALLNYLALLGWNPGGERELYSLEELAKEFTLDRVHKGGAVFDVEKLKWFNREHLKRLGDEEYARRLAAFAGHAVEERLVPLLKERAETLERAAEMLEGDFKFLGSISYEPALLLQNGKIERETAKKHLEILGQMLHRLPDEDYTPIKLKTALWPYATQEGRGAVLWPLRVALSGQEKSPDPFTLAHFLGKNEVSARLEEALKKLS